MLDAFQCRTFLSGLNLLVGEPRPAASCRGDLGNWPHMGIKNPGHIFDMA